MEQVLLTFGIALVFYVLIPGIGAFLVRSRWRHFRRRMLDASMDPIAGYEQFRTASSSADGTVLGLYRFFGSLEALQGDDVVWLRNGNVTVAADMTGVRVYTLYPASRDNGNVVSHTVRFPDATPQIIPWNRVGSLPEGTRFFLGGRLEVSRGIPVFRATNDSPLIVVLYEGSDELLLSGSTWSGRQRNEYWNQFTPASLLTGAFALLVLSYLTLKSPLLRLPVLFSLTLSSMPVLPLLPPGVILFFLYRFWWRKARYFRAQRDLVRLPRRFADSASDSHGERPAWLPDGTKYGCEVVAVERDEELERAGTILRRVPEFVDQDSKTNRYLFGRIDDDGVTVGGKPLDPMAEYVVYTQEPDLLADRCDRQARLLETRAGIVFGLCIIVNGYELFLVLSNLVR